MTKADPAMEKAAKKACITGDVARGIDILGDLFVETGDITYVFNQARCFQQNSRWEESIARFEEYLRKSPNLSDASRAEVNGYIAECRAHLSPSAAILPSMQPPAPAAAATPTESAQPASLAAEAFRAPAAPEAASGMRVAGIVSAAVGLVALSTGLYLDYKTHRLVEDVKKNGYDPEKLSSRDSYETWGWVSYGVGAAGLATGLALYLLGTPQKEPGADAAPISIVPAVGPGSFALVLHGALR